jgi:hypothetical protein
VLHADVEHAPRNVAHRRRLHLALIRTAERHRDRTAHAHAGVERRAHDRAEALDRLGDRTVDVPLRERFARRSEHDDLVGLRHERAFEALQVRH